MIPDPATVPPGTVLLTVAEGAGRTAVALQLLAQGRDYVLLVGGGAAHVGAVALHGPPAAAGEPATALGLLPRHREGPLAADGAAAVSAATGRACAAVAGIHQDGATPAEIAAIVANARAGFRRLAAELAGGAAAPREEIPE